MPNANQPPLRIVHLARGSRFGNVWTPAFVDAVRARGELTLVEDARELDTDDVLARLREHDVAIVGWDSIAVPAELATEPGSLRYVCSYSGTIRHSVPRQIVETGIPVTNWGDLPAYGVGEAAMTLLLSAIHDLPVARRAQQDGRWGYDTGRTGTLRNLAVGVYGVGQAGSRFVEMLRPFGARILAHDPYVEHLPDGVERVESLAELCDRAEALVIHAGLSDETRGSIDASMLGRLPDGGIVINTARGGIVDQDALFAELLSGRLRAGLDVLEPDGVLDPDHPLRAADNVTFTFHAITDEAGDHWPPRDTLTQLQQCVVDQLDRLRGNEPLAFVFDVERYDRST